MDEASKNRFDALMKLAELRSGIREKRREIEWKVSASVWALTAGAIAYLRGYPVAWLLTLLAVVVVTHAWFWVRPHYNSSQRDIEQVYYFMEHATRLVLPGSVADPGDKLPIFADERKTWEFIKHEPIWFEIGATALLGMIVVMLSQAPLKAN